MKVLKYMLIFVPISFIAEFMHASPSIMFILAALSIIPLAGLMGEGTEEMSFYSGPKSRWIFKWYFWKCYRTYYIIFCS